MERNFKNVAKITSFFKRETVLAVSLILAALSCFLVKPDAAYAGYIDFHTLALLFCLMAVMAGLQEIGLFVYIGGKLLNKVHTKYSLVFLLVFLCFFSSMLVTNDVALITFVPLAILILQLSKQEHLLCTTVILQTIAANLGSMMTPIGNPQNLYLYTKSGLSTGDFLLLMFPYTVLAGALLALSIWMLYHKQGSFERVPIKETKIKTKPLIYYSILFLLCLLSVAKLLPVWMLLAIIVIALLLGNRKLFTQIDYGLLLTFAAFFIFIGNMGRYPAFRNFLTSIIHGREQLTAILSSQVISNVPAALLLSGFTNRWNDLILGTNIGGLGTLIASMASLISYKQISSSYPEQKRKYLCQFTLWNVAFLAVFLLITIVS